MMALNLKSYAEDSCDGRESKLKTIVVTMGENGVLLMHEGHFTHYPKKLLDSSLIKSVVGAGDSFLGAFMVSLL